MATYNLKESLEAMINLHAEENGRHEAETGGFVFDDRASEAFSEGMEAAMDLVKEMAPLMQAEHAKQLENAYREGFYDRDQDFNDSGEDMLLEASNTFALIHKDK